MISCHVIVLECMVESIFTQNNSLCRFVYPEPQQVHPPLDPALFPSPTPPTPAEFSVCCNVILLLVLPLTCSPWIFSSTYSITTNDLSLPAGEFCHALNGPPSMWSPRTVHSRRNGPPPDCLKQENWSPRTICGCCAWSPLAALSPPTFYLW